MVTRMKLVLLAMIVYEEMGLYETNKNDGCDNNMSIAHNIYTQRQSNSHIQPQGVEIKFACPTRRL